MTDKTIPKYVVDKNGYAYDATPDLLLAPGFTPYDGKVGSDGYATENVVDADGDLVYQPGIKHQTVVDGLRVVADDLPAVRLTARHEDISLSDPANAPDSNASGVLSGGVFGHGNVDPSVTPSDVRGVTTGAGHTALEDGPTELAGSPQPAEDAPKARKTTSRAKASE